MKANTVFTKTRDCQDVLYKELNNYSEKHKVLGRLCALPVSLIDVTMDVLKVPLVVIENVAKAALNLIGAAFFKDCNIKDALYNVEIAAVNFVCIPIKLGMAPLKIVYQFFAILIDPTKVQSSYSLNPTFKA